MELTSPCDNHRENGGKPTPLKNLKVKLDHPNYWGNWGT